MATDNRVALVTGGNKGIGLEIVRQLVLAGVDVTIGSRDSGRGQGAAERLASDGVTASAVQLDVNDETSCAAAAEMIAERHGRLDILVNNAGIFDFADGPPSKATLAAVRRTMETNFFGALNVTQAMLPLLLAAPAPRIVNVSSSLGSLAGNANPESRYYTQRFIGYNASKAALNLLTIQLREEFRDSKLVVNSVSPGFVKTDLTGYGDITPEEGARTPVRYALAGDENGRFLEALGDTPW